MNCMKCGKDDYDVGMLNHITTYIKLVNKQMYGHYLNIGDVHDTDCEIYLCHTCCDELNQQIKAFICNYMAI